MTALLSANREGITTSDWWLGVDAAGGEEGVPGYQCRGRGGQYVFVIPERELVCVFTSGYGGAPGHPGSATPFAIMRESVLPALAPELAS